MTSKGPEEFVIALPIVWDLDWLPYFAASQSFQDHAGGCEQCHRGAYHRDEFPPEARPEDLFCPPGLDLFTQVQVKIGEQHILSLQN